MQSYTFFLTYANIYAHFAFFFEYICVCQFFYVPLHAKPCKEIGIKLKWITNRAELNELETKGIIEAELWLLTNKKNILMALNKDFSHCYGMHHNIVIDDYYFKLNYNRLKMDAWNKYEKCSVLDQLLCLIGIKRII